MSKLLNKASPDLSAVLVNTPKSKVQLKKLHQKNKPTIICFVSKSLSPVETNAAVQRMEEGAFQAKDKAVFIVVSLDSLKAAQDLHAEGAIRQCIHLFSATQGKEFGIVRTPAHVVVGTDLKIKMITEEEVAPYMSFIKL